MEEAIWLFMKIIRKETDFFVLKDGHEGLIREYWLLDIIWTKEVARDGN